MEALWAESALADFQELRQGFIPPSIRIADSQNREVIFLQALSNLPF
jgi:hypothetical protein